MIIKVYTVYDSKAECYLPPFYFKSTGEAVRAFSETVNQPTSTIGKHYSDYTLFEIGEYDDSSGMFSNYEPKIALGNGIEFLHTDDGVLKL